MTIWPYGFNHLLISSNVTDISEAQRLHKLAVAASIPISREAEGLIDTHEWAGRRGTLIIKERPSVGWITAAEHGSLAVRPNEYYIHPAMGCQSACTYCYLLANPHGRLPLRIHLRLDELISEIEGKVRNRSAETALFCTGELADSLADVELWPAAAILVRRFSAGDLGFLEFRTKSDRIGPLLPLRHNRRTTVAFSIAPERNVHMYEPATASLKNRLHAAAALARVGYPVAFKCEPIIADPGWEEQYSSLFAQVVTIVAPQYVDHLSVGCLRWSQQLATNSIFIRKHQHEVEEGTLIEYRPNKFNGTLERERRLAIYTGIRRMIRQAGLAAPIWWSLEEQDLIAELGSS